MSKAQRSAITAAVNGLVGLVEEVIDSDNETIEIEGLDPSVRAGAERVNQQNAEIAAKLKAGTRAFGTLVEALLHDINRIADRAGYNEPGPIGTGRPIPVRAIGDPVIPDESDIGPAT